MDFSSTFSHDIQRMTYKSPSSEFMLLQETRDFWGLGILFRETAFSLLFSRSQKCFQDKGLIPEDQIKFQLLFITKSLGKRLKESCQDCSNTTSLEVTSMIQIHTIYLSGQSASWWGFLRLQCTVHSSFSNPATVPRRKRGCGD